jgi:hypothetical protein
MVSFVLGNKQHWIHSKWTAVIIWGIVVFVGFVPMWFEFSDAIQRGSDGLCEFKYTSVTLPVLQVILLISLLSMAYKLKQPQFGDHFFIKSEFKILGMMAVALFVGYTIVKYGVRQFYWPLLGETISFAMLLLCLFGSIYYPLILTIIHYRSIKALHAIESAKMVDIKAQLEMVLSDEEARSALTTYCESQFCVENVMFL